MVHTENLIAPAFLSPLHLCDYLSELSTVLLLAQAQYQEPFPFLGEFIKRILACIVPAVHRLITQASTSVPDSSLSSDVSPCLEELRCLPPAWQLHRSVNSTLTALHVIICKHLVYEVMEYSLKKLLVFAPSRLAGGSFYMAQCSLCELSL